MVILKVSSWWGSCHPRLTICSALHLTNLIGSKPFGGSRLLLPPAPAPPPAWSRLHQGRPTPLPAESVCAPSGRPIIATFASQGSQYPHVMSVRTSWNTFGWKSVSNHNSQFHVSRGHYAKMYLNFLLQKKTMQKNFQETPEQNRKKETIKRNSSTITCRSVPTSLVVHVGWV